MGVENIQLSGLPPSQGGLGEDQVRGLLAAGWELDTQGISHADLVTLDSAALRYQVAVARQHPAAALRRAGQLVLLPVRPLRRDRHRDREGSRLPGSTTVVPGWAGPRGDAYRLPRLRVLGGTSGTQLLSEIASIRAAPPAPSSYTGA